MNKSCGSNLRFNSQLNGKNHQPTFDDLVCVNLIKKLNVTNPLLLVEFKLNYLHIYVYTVTIKNNI
jgi:hypothetical protein